MRGGGGGGGRARGRGRGGNNEGIGGEDGVKRRTAKLKEVEGVRVVLEGVLI